MAAYIAFLIDIHDQAAFTSYARAAAPTYPIYGGGVALRGPIIDVLEGTSTSIRTPGWWCSSSPPSNRHAPGGTPSTTGH